MAAVDVEALRRRLTTAVKAFTPAQLVLAGLLTTIAVVGGLTFWHWVSQPSYAVLYSGLAAKDASDITAKLSQDGVPYKLTGNGSTIEVPAGSVDKEHLAMASAGLPKGGSGGWSVLDKEGLTTSSFRQQVDYQRALEGEIARTLSSMDGVSDAQVHLVLPEEKLFTEDQQHARASVLLSTNRTLTDDQVQAVINTVASAVPDLDPSAVTVTDSSGHLLSAKSSGSNNELAQQATFEDAQVARAQSMLDQLLGAGHSVVRVSAAMNFDQTKSTVKTVDPTQTVITGSDKTTETYNAGNGSTTPQGPTTVTNSTPPTTSSTNGAASYTKTTETTTTQSSERLDDITHAPGQVTRQSVAVVLDSSVKSLPPDAQVEQLVANALGLDPKRGDTIVVSNAAFDSSATPAAKPKASSPLGGKTLGTALGALMLVIITILLARAARRPKVKPIDLADEMTALPQGARAALPAGSGRAIPAQRSGADAGGDDGIDLLTAVDSHPDDVTLLLRGWLSDGSASSASTSGAAR